MLGLGEAGKELPSTALRSLSISISYAPDLGSWGKTFLESM